MRKIRISKARPKKKTAARRPYNAQTGQLTGREIEAQKRLEKLTQDYINDGMDAASARQRARDVMRDNPRKDWRGG